MNAYDEQNLKADEFEDDMVDDMDEEVTVDESEETSDVRGKEVTSPLKAIRAFCIDCQGGAVREIKSCTAPKCPLYAFRMGKNPYRKRELSPEHLAKLQEARKKTKQG